MFAVPPNTIALPGRRSIAHPARIALEYAEDRGRWSQFLRYDPADRWMELLESTEDHEVWLMSWLPGQRTELHDHSGSTGAFTIVSGMLVERVSKLAANGRAVQLMHTLTAGKTRVFGPDYVHQVTNEGPDPAVSIHVFSPGRIGMTTYRDDIIAGAIPAG